MYIVIEDFFDLQDENTHYSVGDTFPREGYGVTPKRILELIGTDNIRRRPVIEEKKDAPKPKRKRGGKNVSDRPDTSC